MVLNDSAFTFAANEVHEKYIPEWIGGNIGIAGILL